MADGFIVRKGGVAIDLTAAPSLTLVSKSFFEIVFTITNNDTETVDIFWEVDDTTPDANILSLAGGETSSNITISNLADDTLFIIYAFANAENKNGSQSVVLPVTTDAFPYIIASGGEELEYSLDGKNYKSHTFLTSDNFEVTKIGSDEEFNVIDYLIIAGGGNGANGGGGAGGYRTTVTPTPGNSTPNPKISANIQIYPVIVGGATGNSSAFNVISTRGGSGNAGSGGSGAGSLADQTGTGLATTGGPGIVGQGNNGGGCFPNASGSSVGGGGGGAAGGGGFGDVAGRRGAGGAGHFNNLRSGTDEQRAGGGTGAGTQAGGGGAGGGGFGPGDINTGSGGAGGNVGGSGIVIIRYEIAPSV